MARALVPMQQILPDRSPCEELYDRPPTYRWQCPTLAEFMRQVEHRFGDSFSPSGLYSAGIGSQELLPPSTLRAFCEQLGVPPEDFGV